MKTKKRGIANKPFVSRRKTWQISKLNKEQKYNIKEMIHHFLRMHGCRNNATFLTDEIMDIIRLGIE